MAEHWNIRDHPHLGRYAKNLARIALVAFIIIVWILHAIPVKATIAQPDSLSLSDVHVNRNLIQTGDILFYFEYNIAYSSTPTVIAPDTFIFKLYGTDGTTELGRNVPYAFETLGYGYGISCIYFPASTAPTWNGTYTLSVEGNPIQFASIPSYSFVLSTANYTSYTATNDNQEELASKLLVMVQDLEVRWNRNLIATTSAVLGTSGYVYMKYTIPNIENLAPDLIGSTVVIPDYTARNYTTNNLSTTYKNRYNGTFMGNFTSDLGGLFGTGASLAGGLLVVAGCVALIIFSAVKLGNALPGFLGATLVQIGGYLMGFLPAGFMGIIGFFFVIYIGYWWFFIRG